MLRLILGHLHEIEAPPFVASVCSWCWIVMKVPSPAIGAPGNPPTRLPLGKSTTRADGSLLPAMVVSVEDWMHGTSSSWTVAI